MKMDEYKDIIGVIKETPPVHPSDDFTERVMGLIPVNQPRIWWRLKDAILRPGSTPMFKTLTEAHSWAECSFCFLLAGFFYFVMGIVLILGFKTLGTQMPVARWIAYQPQIAFMTAFGFILLGISLLKKNLLVIKMAHLGTFIYIGFAVINVIAAQVASGGTSLMVGILPFMGGGILVGTFLATIVKKYRRRVVSG